MALGNPLDHICSEKCSVNGDLCDEESYTNGMPQAVKATEISNILLRKVLHVLQVEGPYLQHQ
jgi:hypothetical protein